MTNPEVSGTGWRKSSHSGANGDCVEVSLPGWRKSSYSGSNGGCVEVTLERTMVGVRDSKDITGPVLSFDVVAWRAFVESVR